MGLFSGGFLGSGSDESSTQTTTNVTTTTNIRDIGLTGQHAVDLAAVLTGNIGNTLLGASEINANSFNRMVSAGETIIDQGTAKIVQAAKETASPALAIAQGSQNVMMLMIAVLGGIYFMSRKGRA